jgi:multidrug efflux pump
MKISDITIMRPVFATVLSLAILLIGLMAYSRLPVREYPSVDEPIVSVRTTYPGASPEVMESQVTQVLEDSISGIDGIRTLTAVSREQVSQITVEFTLGRDPDAVAAEVRDRVSRARGALPDEIDEPVVARVEADAEPIIRLGFTSDRHSALEITDYVDRYLADRLQTIPGVAQVQIGGERRYAMRLWLDPVRLAGYGLTVQDVESALRSQNVEIPSGRVEGASREFSVLAATDLARPEDFEKVVLRVDSGFPIRLSDVGRAELGAEDDRVVIRFNNSNAVSLGIVRQATANPLDIKQALEEMLPAIREDLPAGMDMGFAYDSTTFIERSIENVWHTVAEAVGLVILVIFLFLRNLRATLIPLVTIPVSLVGAFALMAVFGFSVNTLTLLAMVLAIGLVVDDAIVVLENIARHVEEGMAPLQAALVGSREIGFAVVAMTITLAAVYVPVGFMTGRTGRLFTEFALTLASAVLVSGFVALTLTPMMSGRLLRRREQPGRAYLWGERVLDAVTDLYVRALRAALRRRLAVGAVMLATFAGSFWLFNQLPSELSPAEDRGGIMVIGTAPQGATIDYMTDYAREVEAAYAEVPEREFYFLGAGLPQVNQFRSYVGLKPWEERDRSVQEILPGFRERLAAIPGARAVPVAPPSLGARGFQAPVQFVVQTSASYAELDTMMRRLMDEARTNPGLVNVDTDLRLNTPQLRVAVDRDKAADLGVPVDTIGRTLESMLGGRRVTRFEMNGEQYEVIVRSGDEDRVEPEQLDHIHVRARSGTMVPLSNLVTLSEAVAPQELNRFDRMRAATLTANLAPGYALGDALTWLEAAAGRTLPADQVQITFNGESREFRDSSAGMVITFGLALAFIYLVLAAQFESWRDPLIILLTVPLSAAGALLALQLTGNSLNVYSQIGLVTLIGLITKHGIMIVEFANQARAAGDDILEAVEKAARLRLRPILMTTGAMVLGSLPLALAEGAGAEARSAIGWVIVGGISLGTLLTLFVIPAAYTVISRRKGDVRDDPAGEEHPSPVPIPAE